MSEDIRAHLELIEIARDRSKDTIRFLVAVRDNLWQDLGCEGPIPISLRLQAADILRRFAALPSNVTLDVGTKVEIIYEGDRGVVPVAPKSAEEDIPVLQRKVPEQKAVGGPRGRKKNR